MTKRTKYLTAEFIRAAASKDPRIDSEIELDEIGKAIVWLTDGYTWNAQDDNRSVEGFIISDQNSDQAERDTIEYWNDCVSKISTIREEA